MELCLVMIFDTNNLFVIKHILVYISLIWYFRTTGLNFFHKLLNFVIFFLFLFDSTYFFVLFPVFYLTVSSTIPCYFTFGTSKFCNRTAKASWKHFIKLCFNCLSFNVECVHILIDLLTNLMLYHFLCNFYFIRAQTDCWIFLLCCNLYIFVRDIKLVCHEFPVKGVNLAIQLTYHIYHHNSFFIPTKLIYDFLLVILEIRWLSLVEAESFVEHS